MWWSSYICLFLAYWSLNVVKHFLQLILWSLFMRVLRIPSPEHVNSQYTQFSMAAECSMFERCLCSFNILLLLNFIWQTSQLSLSAETALIKWASHHPTYHIKVDGLSPLITDPPVTSSTNPQGDTQGLVKIVFNYQVPSSNNLEVMMFWRFSHVVTEELNNDNGICRTPGLLLLQPIFDR